MANNTGYACCTHCGAEYRLFTIFNRDMQALCKIWRRRHEHGCQKRTPAQRRKWAAKYTGLDMTESSITVDLNHPGFAVETGCRQRVEIVADLPSPIGGRGAIRAGEVGDVVWDEPGGDVIVEFLREVPNEGLLSNKHQAWVPRSMVLITKS